MAKQVKFAVSGRASVFPLGWRARRLRELEGQLGAAQRGVLRWEHGAALAMLGVGRRWWGMAELAPVWNRHAKAHAPKELRKATEVRKAWLRGWLVAPASITARAKDRPAQWAAERRENG